MLFRGIHNTLCVLVSVLKVRDNQTVVQCSINPCTSEDLLLLGLLSVDDQINGSSLAFVVIPTIFQAEDILCTNYAQFEVAGLQVAFCV